MLCVALAVLTSHWPFVLAFALLASAGLPRLAMCLNLSPWEGHAIWLPSYRPSCVHPRDVSSAPARCTHIECACNVWPCSFLLVTCVDARAVIPATVVGDVSVTRMAVGQAPLPHYAAVLGALAVVAAISAWRAVPSLVRWWRRCGSRVDNREVPPTRVRARASTCCCCADDQGSCDVHGRGSSRGTATVEPQVDGSARYAPRELVTGDCPLRGGEGGV